MADNEKPAVPEWVQQLMNATVDKIEGFGEGVAQTIYMFFLNMTFWQKVAMVVLGAATGKLALNELKNFLMDDPEFTRETAKYIKRKEFREWFDKHADRAWALIEGTFRALNQWLTDRRGGRSPVYGPDGDVTRSELKEFFTTKIPEVLKSIRDYEHPGLQRSIRDAQKRNLSLRRRIWTANWMGIIASALAFCMVFVAPAIWKWGFAGVLTIFIPITVIGVVYFGRRYLRHLSQTAVTDDDNSEPETTSALTVRPEGGITHG